MASTIGFRLLESSKLFDLNSGDSNPCGAIAQCLSIINELTRASRWKVEQFLEALQQETIFTFVAEAEQAIVGFAIFSVVAPEAHIVNIAVAPNFQGQGIGINLLTYAADLLLQQEVTECWLEVRESNQKAQAFYKKFGFAVVQRRVEFYEEPKEDAWLMKIDLQSLGHELGSHKAASAALH